MFGRLTRRGGLTVLIAVSVLAGADRSGALGESPPEPRLPRDKLLVYRGVDGAVQPARSVEDWLKRRDEIVRGMQRDNAPLLDRSLHALVTDLHDRGLDRDVAVVVCGEMGRTPRINKAAGRDHWPMAGFALFAGGGLRTGQVIGATDAHGELYHVLGIDPGLTFPDHTGRLRSLLDDQDTIAELV